MYFAAEVDGNKHLWSQRFPNGQPEQITFGPTEEDGIAMAPDGRSLITSIGSEQSAIWIHDSRGERPLSVEGYLAPMRVFPYSSVRFSPDGKLLYYLMRRDSPASAAGLWRTNLASGASEPVLRDVSIAEYDLSRDGREVIFSNQPYGKSAQLWVAPVDRSAPPKLIASGVLGWPRFGPESLILFQLVEANANYMLRMNKDGSFRSKVAPYPVGNVYGTSPDRRWIVAGLYPQGKESRGTMALPVDGGAARTICPDTCPAAWAPDGRFFYVGVEPKSRTSFGKTVAIPVPPGETFPKLPASGIRGLDDVIDIPGCRVIERWDISPGPDPSIFAFVNTAVHRNLFRIQLPVE